MVFSNTAVPEYYGRFRQAVINREIPVNEEISREMDRMDARIANPNFYYDSKAIDGFIRFCEDEMTLTDGSDLVLLDTFKLWAESALSWFHFKERVVPVKQENGTMAFVKKKVKLRLINKQYLIVARGAAKSMYAELLQAYFLVVDTSTTHQITVAPTMKQAEEVMAPFRTAIARAKGPVFKFLTEGSLFNTTGSKANRVKLASTKIGIQNFMTESKLEVRPMSIDKLQSLRTKMNTIDEWLSGDVREDVVSAVEQGASKLDDYLILAISSEGTVRNGSGDTIKLELQKILRGEFTGEGADNVSIWHYKLDDESEVNNPEMWIKAQPNIGITVSYDAYQRDVERALNVPAAKNDILAKRFGLPVEGFTYFFTYEDTIPFDGQLDYRGQPCSMGADLSQGDDFCAFTFLFPDGRGGFGVKTRSYITELTLNKLPLAMRQKYDEFIREGTLIIMDRDVVLDMEKVFEDLENHIDANAYEVFTMGYDPWGAQVFMDLWYRSHGAYGTEKIIQGARTESVPLGELKILAGERLLYFNEKLMSFTMGNAIVLHDSNNNKKLSKKRNEEKIDNVSAMMDAYVAYTRNKDQFA